ncbi:hypothetical protein Tsubulata_027313 [Turnera subulata]|uniref:ELM2 domain-containing protein n=1 Tax=Turnera subulata TaxID=218843 RepID=A0A9Q0IYQ6_9ROSI|nr:hypothetical protein Tsubulata_027313 [Turnera subulata]
MRRRGGAGSGRAICRRRRRAPRGDVGTAATRGGEEEDEVVGGDRWRVWWHYEEEEEEKKRRRRDETAAWRHGGAAVAGGGREGEGRVVDSVAARGVEVLERRTPGRRLGLVTSGGAAAALERRGRKKGGDGVRLWCWGCRWRWRCVSSGGVKRKRKLQKLYSKLKSPSLLPFDRSSHHVEILSTCTSLSFTSSIVATECSSVQVVLNSCSSDAMLIFEDNAKHFDMNLNCIDNATEYSSSNKDVSPLTNKDGSVNCSNRFNPTKTIVKAAATSALIDSANSSTFHKKQRKGVRSLKVDYQTRPVIPVGPGFQAKVLDWTGSNDLRNHYNDGDSENLKWLGTRVWPLKDEGEEAEEDEIGKGRPDSCSCLFGGSAKCIKLHTLEARLRLRSTLGPAFSSWKFDEMGECVSYSWSLMEQRKIDSLVKGKYHLRKRTLKSLH